VAEAPIASKDPGSLFWDFLETLVASRRVFHSVYRRYERRVLTAARAAGVSRDALRLAPEGLARLFHLGRLEHLRDHRAAPLRDLSQRLFPERGDQALIDVYCSHIYHELAILSEEHRSVGRFVRIRDRRSYAQLFQEVSRYYPVRLRRIRRFLDAAWERVEGVLPEWGAERVVVRSAYLFGERLARQAWGEGLEALYRRMYPRGGPVRGYLVAALSFRDSGFLPEAARAATLAVEAAPTGGRVARVVREARAEAERLVASLSPGTPAVEA
jgi:hypothetical protein